MKRIVTALLGAAYVLMPGVLMSGAASAQNRSVVVYTAGPELLRGLAPVFQQRTGYEMQIVTAGSGELTQRLRAEAQRPQADVAVSLGAAIIESNPNLFEAYTPADYDKVNPDLKLSQRWLPFTAVSETVIAINTRLVPEAEAPTSWEALADPRYRGRIAYAGADRSGSAFTQLGTLLHIFGDERGWALFERILPNLIITGSSGQVIQGVASGEYPIGLTLEDGALRFIQGGAPVRIIYPSEGASMLPDAMALVARGPNPQGGRLVLDFITSVEAQTLLAQQFGRRPIRNDVPGPNGLAAISSIRVHNFPMQWAADNRRAIMERYTGLVRR
jgi:iron(III) transport system substrate-binding protein